MVVVVVVVEAGVSERSTAAVVLLAETSLTTELPELNFGNLSGIAMGVFSLLLASSCSQ